MNIKNIRIFFLLTTLALCRGVQVKDHIHGLSQLQGCAFALRVPAHRSDVHCLGEKGAVEEFLRLEQDGQTSLLVHKGDEKRNPSVRGGVDNNAKFKVQHSYLGSTWQQLLPGR